MIQFNLGSKANRAERRNKSYDVALSLLSTFKKDPLFSEGITFEMVICSCQMGSGCCLKV